MSLESVLLKKNDKILLVGPAWIGDMIMAQTLMQLLKAERPNCQLDVLAPKWTFPLLERMPEVSNAIELPIGHGELKFSQRYHIAKILKQNHYAEAIILPNSWKSALIPFLARIPTRRGWRGEMRYGLLNDLRKLDKAQYPLMIERFMALGLTANTDLAAINYRPQLHTNPVNSQAAANKYQLTTDKPILALCPGAEFGPAKRWPSQHYAAVAQEFHQQGWHVWLFGSPKEQPIAAEIQSITNNICQDLSGKTSLAEAIDLLSLANVAVCNDSGLMHIAAALQKPLIAVYGSTSPGFTPPLNDEKTILRLGLECSPCFQRECPLGHLKCLTDIKPDMVIEAISALQTTG